MGVEPIEPTNHMLADCTSITPHHTHPTMLKGLYTKEMTKSDTHPDTHPGTHQTIHQHWDWQARKTHRAFGVRVSDGESCGESCGELVGECLGEYVAKANSPQSPCRWAFDDSWVSMVRGK